MEYLLRTNLTFQLLLSQLVNGQKLDKNSTLVASLDIEAKYELIKMKSSGQLDFKEGKVLMTYSGLQAYGKMPTLCELIRKVG